MPEGKNLALLAAFRLSPRIYIYTDTYISTQITTDLCRHMSVVTSSKVFGLEFGA